jgi:hypothetical protein
MSQTRRTDNTRPVDASRDPLLDRFVGTLACACGLSAPQAAAARLSLSGSSSRRSIESLLDRTEPVARYWLRARGV